MIAQRECLNGKESAELRELKPKQLMERLARSLLLKEFDHVEKEYNRLDMFGYILGGDSCEIEIKASYADFCKEINVTSKIYKHRAYKLNAKKNNGFCPTRFYFMVPECKSELVLNRMAKKFPFYGLITWNQLTKEFKIVKKSERLTDMKFEGKVLDRNYKKAYKEALRG